MILESSVDEEQGSLGLRWGGRCSPPVSPLGLPGSQPKTLAAFSDSDFTGLDPAPPPHTQWPTRAFPEDFSTPSRFSLDPWGRTSHFFGECGSVMALLSTCLLQFRGVACPSNQNVGLVATVSFSSPFPYCPVSTSEDVLSLLPRPRPPSEIRCRVFCALVITV